MSDIPDLEARARLIYEIEKVIERELCGWTTLDLEKLYIRFVLNRSGDMRTVLEHEAHV